MTERTNRLIRTDTASNATGAPTNLDDYVLWINAREHRKGRWIISMVNGKRALDWHSEIGSEDWIRERGLTPKIGSRAA